MGRGKDGYTSLLIEEEGGKAVEIVSEENGVLISTILRQYFMSLKVLGKWKHWGRSMDRKFINIQTDMQSKHGYYTPFPTSEKASSKLPHRPAPKEPAPRDDNDTTGESAEPPRPENFGLEDNSDEDEDDGADYDDSQPIQFSEKETRTIRRVMRKWWRLSKLQGEPKLCDELGEGEFQVNWTKAIAPRLEGRIKDVTPKKP
jgi:5'-nucleotidase